MTQVETKLCVLVRLCQQFLSSVRKCVVLFNHRNEFQFPLLCKRLRIFIVEFNPLEFSFISVLSIYVVFFAIELKEDYISFRQFVDVSLNARTDMFTTTPPLARNLLNLFIKLKTFYCCPEALSSSILRKTTCSRTYANFLYVIQIS